MKEVLVPGSVFEAVRRTLSIRSSFQSVPSRLWRPVKSEDRVSLHRGALQSASSRSSCDRSCPEDASTRTAKLRAAAGIQARIRRLEPRGRHLEERNTYRTAHPR